MATRIIANTIFRITVRTSFRYGRSLPPPLLPENIGPHGGKQRAARLPSLPVALCQKWFRGDNSPGFEGIALGGVELLPPGRKLPVFSVHALSFVL